MLIDWIRSHCRLVQSPGEVAHILVSAYLDDSPTDDREAVYDELIQIGMILDRTLRGDSRTRLVIDDLDHSGLI